MTDQSPGAAAPSPQTGPIADQPVTASSPPAAGVSPPAGAAALVEERPELAAGAAFAAGFLCAMILRRLAR